MPNAPALVRLWQASVLVAAMLLSACGGGTAEPSSLREFTTQAARLHPMAARESAQALSVTEVDARALFDWAEYKLPSLFPKGAATVQIVFEGAAYTVRAYANGNHLGLREDGAVFGLGPFTAGSLTPLGRLADYAAAVVADQCLVDPARCAPPGPPTGTRNACTMDAAELLQPGTRVVLDFVSYIDNPDAPTALMFLDTVVEGEAVFEGIPAVRIAGVLRGSATEDGVSVSYDGTVASYSQVGPGGLERELGGEVDAVYQAGGQSFGSRSRFVVKAGGLGDEFLLQPGQTMTKEVTSAVSVLAPTVEGPFTDAASHTITFEGRETIVVPAGSFDTCRYRTVDSNGLTTLDWYIVGRGIPAKSQFIRFGVTETQVLRFGSFNGGPL